jgi:hypothetical protein
MIANPQQCPQAGHLAIRVEGCADSVVEYSFSSTVRMGICRRLQTYRYQTGFPARTIKQLYDDRLMSPELRGALHELFVFDDDAHAVGGDGQ